MFAKVPNKETESNKYKYKGNSDRRSGSIIYAYPLNDINRQQ